jgi:hypothetical protein
MLPTKIWMDNDNKLFAGREKVTIPVTAINYNWARCGTVLIIIFSANCLEGAWRMYYD